MKDLRTFLTDVEARLGPVHEIDAPVSVDRELAAIVRLLEDQVNPVLFFRRIVGRGMPVITGVHGTRERIALALGTTVRDTTAEFVRRLDHPIDPVQVDHAPVKDVAIQGCDVDLGLLPIPRHAEKDGGSVLTCAVGIARDQASGAVNTGIYRMQVMDRNHVSVCSGTDLSAIIEAGERDAEPVEFVVSIGHHPAFQISSQAKIPRTVDSLGVAGAMLQEPLAIVGAETVGLAVPARAEIVLEGRFVPGAREPDGPFGESPRYYESGWGYVLEVSAITHRSDAMYLDINNVHGEHPLLSCVPAREAQLLRLLRSVYPHVEAVRIPSRTAGMHAHICVDPRRAGEAMQIGMVGLGAIPRLKHAVVVNTDVDIFDDESVLWALATRFQGDRDLLVVPYVAGTEMDPSGYALHDRALAGDLRTQVIFDATIPVGIEFRERADSVGAAFAGLDASKLLCASASASAPPTPWRM